jgi:hypothetical protein
MKKLATVEEKRVRFFRLWWDNPLSKRKQTIIGRLKMDPKVLILAIVIVGIALIALKIANQRNGKESK